MERHSWNQNANCVVERKRVQSCEALTDDLSCVLSDSYLLLRVCLWTLPADISSLARTNHGVSSSGDGVHCGCPFGFRPLERHTIGGIHICIPQHESQFLSFLSLHRLLIGEGAPRRATTWVTPQRAMAVERKTILVLLS